MRFSTFEIVYSTSWPPQTYTSGHEHNQSRPTSLESLRFEKSFLPRSSDTILDYAGMLGKPKSTYSKVDFTAGYI